MADDSTPDTPNRATIALVDAKVTGLADLIKSETGAIQRQLDAVAGLPVAVAKNSERIDALSDRISDVENSHGRTVNWWVTGFIALASAIAGGGIAHLPIF